MENIDDLMRQKFDSDDPAERFEFREEYWEQAQALLEKEEARRRRRWWVFALLAMGLCVSTWFLLDWRQDNHSTQLSDNQESNAPVSQKIDGKNSSGQAQSLENSGLPTAISNQPNPEKPKINFEKKPATGDEATKFDILKKGEGKKNAAQLAGTETRFDKIPQSSENEPAPPLQTPAPKISEQPPLSLAKNDNPGISQPSLDQPIQTKEKPDTTLAMASLEILPKALDVRMLPIFVKPLDLPERFIYPKQTPANFAATLAPKPAKSKKLSLGISMAGSAYPADTGGHWAGFTAGFYGDYRLRSNISLRLGAQWRYLPGHWDTASDSTPPSMVEQLRYSFGYRREVWKRETTGLHYLEIPLSACWEKKSWGLEAGAAAGLLLAVQDRTEHSTASSLEGETREIQKFVKGDAAPYYQRYFSIFAGGAYRLNTRLSITARAQYRTTPLLKNAVDGTPNKGFGALDLGLRFRLF